MVSYSGMCILSLFTMCTAAACREPRNCGSGLRCSSTPQRDCHLPKGPGAEDNGKYRSLARCVVIYSAPSNGLMLPLLCEFIFCVSLLSLQMPNCFDSVRQQGSCYLAKFPVNWCARKRNAVKAEECRMSFQQGSSAPSCFHRSPLGAQRLRLRPHFPGAGLSPIQWLV